MVVLFVLVSLGLGRKQFHSSAIGTSEILAILRAERTEIKMEYGVLSLKQTSWL